MDKYGVAGGHPLPSEMVFSLARQILEVSHMTSHMTHPYVHVPSGYDLPRGRVL